MCSSDLPELLDPKRFGLGEARHTKESDRYALGMVILEVLTGKVPFPCCSEVDFWRKVDKGECPDRPQGPEAVWFTDDLWGMLKQCWLPTKELRPVVEDVLDNLNRGLATWKPLPPIVDSDSQVDSDDDLDSTMSHHPRAFFHLSSDLHSPVQCPR